MQSSFTATSNLSCVLSQIGIISLSGDDANSYLQGKVTNDVDALHEDIAQLGCHCDFKGKTWNIFTAVKHSDKILLISHKEGVPQSLAELQKYGVFSKVTFADESDAFAALGMAGPECAEILSQHIGTLPSDHFAVKHFDNGLVICLTSPVQRYLVLGEPAFIETIHNHMVEFSQPETLWEKLDIQAGIANIQSATVAEFVPQMMNMQHLGAISFTKGCYMGQEVVARTKYLGKNKRAAFILTTDSPVTAQAGDVLEKQVGENWRRGGTVLRHATLDDNTWVLAVLPNDTEDSDKFRLKSHPQHPFAVHALPYSTIEDQ
ncbi:MAG: tRNA-modifying protein YgfZ [Aliiglaciecola sp.]